MGGIMDGAVAGKAAALAAAALWAVTVTVLTFASRRLGSQVANGARLVLAVLLIGVIHWAVAGTPWPGGLGGTRTLWLLASGLLGFTLADGLGLESFVRLGARDGMLVQTLAPAFSALLAHLFLGQRLGWLRGGAVLLTLAGIALVVAQASGGEAAGHRRGRWIGVSCALGAAMAQATAQLASILGMADGVPALSATVVRLAAGSAGVLVFLGLRGRLRGLKSAWRDGAAAGQVLSGTLLGSVAAVPLSLYALAHAPAGVAATLMFMVPVFLLPLSRLFLKEPITPGALAGTGLTLAGASALFLL